MVSGLKPINKASSKQSFNNYDNTTIDAKHSEMITHFKNLQESLPQLKEELKKLVNEYNNKDANRKNEIEYILYRDNLKDKIHETRNKINNINNSEEINKYYLNVGVLLHSYYENIENSKNELNDSKNFEDNLINYDEDIFHDNLEEESDTKKQNSKNIVNFFNNKNDSLYTSLKISDFVKEESTFKKKDILEEYLQKIDSKYISKIKIDQNICKCPNCNDEMIIYPSDGIQICNSCGIQQNILIESDRPSFKDPPMEVCYFSYKRVNHFNELIYKLIIIYMPFIKVVC
jgi:hypothetical protein